MAGVIERIVAPVKTRNIQMIARPYRTGFIITASHSRFFLSLALPAGPGQGYLCDSTNGLGQFMLSDIKR